MRSGILFRTQPQGPARPHPGHQHRAAVLRAAVRRGEARDQRGRAGRERAARLPRLARRGRPAPRDPAPRVGHAGGAKRARPRRATAAGGIVDAARARARSPRSSTRTLAPPESVVKMHPGRLIGSIVLQRHAPSSSSARRRGGIVLVAVSRRVRRPVRRRPGAASASVSFYVQPVHEVAALHRSPARPTACASASACSRPATRRCRPAASTRSQVSQPLLWRPFGWWEIKVNRAEPLVDDRARRARRTRRSCRSATATMCCRVLELVLPELVGDEHARAARARASTSQGAADDGFTELAAPGRRAALVLVAAQRLRAAPDAVLLRRGCDLARAGRRAARAHAERLADQGPLCRMLRLADRARAHRRRPDQRRASARSMPATPRALLPTMSPQRRSRRRHADRIAPLASDAPSSAPA